MFPMHIEFHAPHGMQQQLKYPEIQNEVTQLLQTLVQVMEAQQADSQASHCDEEPRLHLEVTLEGNRYSVTIGRLADCERISTARLSPREREISHYLMKGLTNKSIANMLNLRPCTVSTYIKRLFLKLNVNSRSQLVATLLTGKSIA